MQPYEDRAACRMCSPTMPVSISSAMSCNERTGAEGGPVPRGRGRQREERPMEPPDPVPATFWSKIVPLVNTLKSIQPCPQQPRFSESSWSKMRPNSGSRYPMVLQSIGVPKEIAPSEKRVALNPIDVGRLVAAGWEVRVETGAGSKCRFLDETYSHQGATIVDKKSCFSADIVAKIQCPTAFHLGQLAQEAMLMSRHANLICFLWPESDKYRSAFEHLKRQKVSCFAINNIKSQPPATIPNCTDLLRREFKACAALDATLEVVGAQAFRCGMDRLRGDTARMSKERDLRLLVVGADTVGLAAVREATSVSGLHTVRVFDPRESVKEAVLEQGGAWVELSKSIIRHPDGEEDEEMDLGVDVDGLVTDAFDQLSEEQMALLQQELVQADICITAVAQHGREAPPVLISTEMLREMQEGSVVVDVSAGLGGNVKATRRGEAYIFEDRVHLVGYVDLSSKACMEASNAFSSCVTEFILNMTNIPSIGYEEDEPTLHAQGGKLVNWNSEVLRAACVHASQFEIQAEFDRQQAQREGRDEGYYGYGGANYGSSEEEPDTFAFDITGKRADVLAQVARKAAVGTLGLGGLVLAGVLFPHTFAPSLKSVGLVTGLSSMIMNESNRDAVAWLCGSALAQAPFESMQQTRTRQTWTFKAPATHDSTDLSRPAWTFLPVGFVGGVMTWVYVTYYRTVGFNSLAESLVFHIPAGLSLISAYRVITTDPGLIPDEWRMEEGDPRMVSLESNERKKNKNLRYCRICRAYKPDRSHHDSHLNRCALKMDHFCPWLNNVIGYFNHKFFLQFLFYTSTSSIWVTGSSMPHLTSALRFLLLPTGAHPSMWKIAAAVNFVMVELVALCFSVALTAFLALHIKMTLKNETTIEAMEGPQKNPGISGMYDLGMAQNLLAVFGPKWYLWLLPIHSTQGDGVHYPNNYSPD